MRAGSAIAINGITGVVEQMVSNFTAKGLYEKLVATEPDNVSAFFDLMHAKARRSLNKHG